MNQPTTSSRNRLRSIARRAMTARGLLPDFSPAVLAETAALTEVPADPAPSVRDLRGLLWVSIDNDDSRDLDQLSVAQPMSGGVVKILVAVADVDAVIKRDSAIDGHARTNTTSVYTPAEIFPMLPEKLSTDLTSLGEGRERLAIVIEMTVAADGTVTQSDLYRAAVLNRA
jgi:exoribonuclease-2